MDVYTSLSGSASSYTTELPSFFPMKSVSWYQMIISESGKPQCPFLHLLHLLQNREWASMAVYPFFL